MIKTDSFLWRAYAYKFLNNFILIYPLYSLMFQNNGLSDGQVGFALIFWSVVTLVFQIPTGMLSDRMSRRGLLILGNVLKALTFLLWLMWPTFTIVLIGFFLWGVQWALDEACFQPLLYEQLRDKRKYLRAVGTCESLSLAATAISALGSFLVFFGYDALTYVSVGALLVSSLVLLTMKTRPPRRYAMLRRGNAIQLLRTAIKGVIHHPRVLGLMMMLGLIVGMRNTDEYFGLIGVELGLPEYAVGLLYFSGLMFGVLGGMVVRRLRTVHAVTVPLLLALAGAAYGVVCVIFNVWAIAALCLFWFIYAIVRSIMFDRFQQSIPSNVRGTTTALCGAVDGILTIVMYMVMTSSVVIGGSYRYAFMILGTLVMVIGIVQLFSVIGKANLKKK